MKHCIHMRRWFEISLLSGTLLLTDCVGDFTPFENDNRYVRELQEKETAKHVPEASRRKELKREIGERVGLIHHSEYVVDLETLRENGTYSQEFAEGRAAAISSDGYYLTAYHVVSMGPFYLVDVKLKQPLEPGPGNGDPEKLMERNEYKGRLVWSDPEHDLAIVKFDQTNVPHFDAMRMELKRGEIVFSADDQSGWLQTPSPDTKGNINWNDRYGNGSFFSAGKVLTSQDGGHSGFMHQHTTLVARGAMSGASIVTVDGELCGILSYGATPYRNHPATSTAFMVSPDLLMDLIDADRRGNR